jgi:outer membrane receptor protein involved in Fe transport
LTFKKNTKFLIFFILISFQTLFSQNISGVVIDEDNKPLEYVSVALLQPKDSLLVKYTSTDINGKFKISAVKKGNYLLQLFLMTYETDQRLITVTENDINLKVTQLKRETNELNEITINAVIPIKIKKDTVAFNAKAFKVRQDDNVGELIKKLPGVEIATDGTVIAQGEEITKILVDGKEFFTNDPTIALQNLSADAIKSIEIIDENSEDSRVSGVKDGEQSKIINLVLKDGKKFGYFGKIGGGYGTNDRYTSNVDINSFTKKTQFAVFGKLNNINNTGASVFQRDGTKSNTDSGLLTTGTAGVNFNYEIKPDYNFNIDYYYGYSDNKQAVRSNRTEFTDDDSFDSKISKVSRRISNNNNVNFSLRNRSIKNTYVSLRGKFKGDNSSFDDANKTIYFDDNGNEDTSSDRISNSEDKRNNGELKFSYRRKISTKGRNLRVTSGISFTNFYDQNFQKSINEYNLSKPEDYEKTEEIITRDDKNDGIKYNVSFRFMEPIVAHHFLSFTSLVNNEIKALDLVERKIVDAIEKPGFDHLQNYFKEQYDNQLGYLYSKDKFQFYASGIYDIKKQHLEVDGHSVLNKTYGNILPKISVNYEIKKGKKFRVYFNKSIQLPNVNQLSPIINDFNPLRISFGNPKLTPSKSNNVNVRYFSHSLKSANSFFIFIRYNKTNNAIVSKRYFDENRVRYSTFENYGSKSDLRGNMHFSRKINKINIRYAVKLNANIFDKTTIIKDDFNVIKSKTMGSGISFSNINKNIFDVTVGANFNLTNATYSIQKTENNYFEQNYFAKFDWDITNSLNFNSQFNNTLYSDSNFDSQSIPIWNVAVQYVFLKSKQANLKLQVIDLLDKDIGVVIRNSPDFYEETFSKNLGTYVMLSFTYSIKPPKGKKTKRSGSGQRRHYTN